MRSQASGRQITVLQSNENKQNDDGKETKIKKDDISESVDQSIICLLNSWHIANADTIHNI